MAAAASTSMTATAVFTPRFPVKTHLSALPVLPRRFFTPPSSASFKHLSVRIKVKFLNWKRFMVIHLQKESRRSSRLAVKASSSDESSSVDNSELLSDLKEKWDAVENKSTVLLYGGGAVVAVWLASVVVGAINSVPLLPKLMELVGLGYTGWFVYRYLLFKQSRKELVTDIESVKKKITGTE